ncbi:NAD(P)H-dependent oxidoreductase [Actinomadura sp. NEAU-AAG7]|uniref:NAD(P)H-dependent oxidoreductase n=1 Tax=Actinomadura sp. NEAU-AAG7 TaxID=2839640 RepID=UPI002032DDAC|nr:NAD(P)H-dependent oxidoreductase [Actinomadura sp. NEAU-AAG7]
MTATEPALRVVVVNGSPSRPSRTMGLVDVVLDTLEKALPVEASRIDVYGLGPGFTGAVERAGAAPEVEDALRLAEGPRRDLGPLHGPSVRTS